MRQEVYWAIIVKFPSGNAYWFSDKDDVYTLTLNESKAKVFLTEGSAQRYIEKLREKNPNSKMIMEPRKLGLQ